MGLTIQTFGDRQSFELIRDEVVIGGFAYMSEMRSPKGNVAFSSGALHIHGVDAQIKAKTANSSNGELEFDIIKSNRDIGELEFDRRGNAKLKLKRVDSGSDSFKIKARGLTSWSFLIEQDGRPVLEIKPTEKYRRNAHHYRVHSRSRTRIPERVLDELTIYSTFAANIYSAKMQGITTGRWPG